MGLHWIKGGMLLGLVFLMAVVLVKPIGVSTQFVILDGILWNQIDSNLITEGADSSSGYSSRNAYLDKSGGKYARNIENPLNYSFVFVLAMIGGAALSGFLRKGVSEQDKVMPQIWRSNYGAQPWKRYLATFLAGFLVLYGARLAGGCTSGHMMSGMMQTAVSGYLFAAGAFLAAIPVAILLFRKGEV